MPRASVAISLFCIVTMGAVASKAQSPDSESKVPPTLRSIKSPRLLPAPSPKPAINNEREPEVEENDIIRVSTNLITVPAEVMDRSGRYIGNLQKEDFRIFEKGIEQEVAYFASVEQEFTVALLLDVSGSTQSQLEAIRAAANAFIKRLRPKDRLILISFDGKINVLTEAITLSELRKKRLRLDALNDGTLLYDTVGFALKERLAAIQGRKAIVLLTDGVDGGSKKSSYKQTLRAAEEGNVIIYTVRYNTLPQLPARLSRIVNPKARAQVQARMIRDYAIGATYLQTLTEKTGGRIYNADNLEEVPQAFALITEELGRQYSLGYYPKGEAKAGERREIKVKTRSPNLVVRARESYVASSQHVRSGSQD